MSQNTNEHITKFLKYYINLPSPEYAVLLDGAWGSGKTHFIDNYSEHNNQKVKFIRISLFGIQTISEITSKIVLEIFGIENKQLISKVSAKIMNSFAKKINLSIEDIPISAILKSKNIKGNIVFVFDDLERTDIEISKVLGYINSLIELSKQKVIILASEKKLIEKQDYKEFKEKVIGKTFEVKQDFDGAFDSFLDLATNSKKVLKNNHSTIKNVFELAGYKNLRHIRQSILDFEHLFENIDEKYIEHSKFMRGFIQEFFAYSIEMKYGKLEKQSIEAEYEKHTDFIVNKDKNTDIKDETIFNKHSFLGYTEIVQFSLWDRFFKQGTLEKEFLTMSFDRSSYFVSKTQEDWVRLWHFKDLENDEFEPLLKKVINKFEKGEYCEQTTLLHVASLLIFFSKEGLYDKSLDDVKKDIRKVIDSCSKSDLWKKDEYKRSFHNRTGLGFMGSDQPEDFNEVQDYLIEKNKKAIIQNLSEIGDKILDLLKQPKDGIYEDLSEKLFNHEHKPPLTTLPVFSSIKPKDFLDVILSIKHKELGDVMETIFERYGGSSYHQGINDDLEFWKKFNELLKKELEKYEGTVKGYKIKYTIKNIDDKIISAIKHRGNYD